MQGRGGRGRFAASGAGSGGNSMPGWGGPTRCSRWEGPAALGPEAEECREWARLMAGDLPLEEGRASSMKGALAMLSATCTHITAWQLEFKAASFFIIIITIVTVVIGISTCIEHKNPPAAALASLRTFASSSST